MPPPPLEPRMIDLSQMERAMSGIADPRLAPAEGPDAYAPKRSLRRLMETASETQSNPRAEDHSSSSAISHSDARMEETQMGEAPSRAIEDLLAERKKTHGSFETHARITQSLKRRMEEEPNWVDLSDRHKEALHMVAHKIGRILAGNPNFHDHWDDIAGYAKLASEACD